MEAEGADTSRFPQHTRNAFGLLPLCPRTSPWRMDVNGLMVFRGLHGMVVIEPPNCGLLTYITASGRPVLALSCIKHVGQFRRANHSDNSTSTT